MFTEGWLLPYLWDVYYGFGTALDGKVTAVNTQINTTVLMQFTLEDGNT